MGYNWELEKWTHTYTNRKVDGVRFFSCLYCDEIMGNDDVCSLLNKKNKGKKPP